MPREKATLTPTERLVRSIAQSNEQLAIGEHTAHSLGRAADLMMRLDDDRSQIERRQLSLMSKMHEFAAAERRLIQNDYSHARERRDDTKVATEYNAALRSMIDENPHLLMREVVDFCTNSYMLMNGRPDELAFFKEQTRAHLDGMRHEIAAENAFWQIAEVDDVRQATPEEDARGVDLVVEYHGQEYGFDIKATQYSADEANQNPRRISPAMQSGFTWDDFNGGFRASNEATERVAPYYADMLEWAEYNGYTLQKSA